MNQQIVDDVVRVGRSLGLMPRDGFSRSQYLQNGGHFSMYQLYEGGTSWSDYCKKAGYSPQTKTPVSDEVYFNRLRKAVETTGRLPRTSERKKFGLNFSKRRWPTLDAFIKAAESAGIIDRRSCIESTESEESEKAATSNKDVHDDNTSELAEIMRLTPPIPEKTKRKRWERTGIEGFPYAPQDESGVVALFAILCAKGIIPWQIVDLNSGRGVDAVCYDDNKRREFRVELKHILSRTGWNHPFDSFDYVVCWENRWRDFPKPVLELKEQIRRATTRA